MTHNCEFCPHDLNVVHVWNNGVYLGTVPIPHLSNEDLLDNYAAEVDGNTRAIGSDPPSNEENLREEILKRMSAWQS